MKSFRDIRLTAASAIGMLCFADNSLREVNKVRYKNLDNRFKPGPNAEYILTDEQAIQQVEKAIKHLDGAQQILAACRQSLHAHLKNLRSK